MKEKICNFVFNNKKNFILITYLYAFLCAFFPSSKIASIINDNMLTEVLCFIISRIILSICPFFVYTFATNDLIDKKIKNNLLLGLVFIICVNNFPFISIILNKVSLSNNVTSWILHIFNCFSVSILEELVFRGIIFTLLFNLFANNKNKVFLSIVISSSAFGLLHLVNLFAGEHIFYVTIQIGYSFLTGVLFAVSYLISRKIAVPIILHFIYNFGGLLQENGLLTGQIWCVFQVVETVIISVIIGVFVLYYIIKYNRWFYESNSSKS